MRHDVRLDQEAPLRPDSCYTSLNDPIPAGAEADGPFSASAPPRGNVQNWVVSCRSLEAREH